MRTLRIPIVRALHVVYCSSTTTTTPITPQVSRDVALSRWKAKPTSNNNNSKEEKGSSGMLGKGMSFASSLGFGVTGSGSSSRSSMEVLSTAADINWDLCERMDYLVQYSVPSDWLMAEQVRENSISIQSTPPPRKTVDETEDLTRLPTVHGISINCFAYKRKVPDPNCEKLLQTFLRRFNASVRNSLEIVHESCYQPSTLPPTTEPKEELDLEDSHDVTEKLAQQLKCAVAEITFTPAPGQPLAHGLCRAFYNTNGRYHYISVVAVPDDEFNTSLDLVVHALISVVESRVEAAAKRL